MWKSERLMENSWEIGVSAQAGEHGREQRKEREGERERLGGNGVPK